MPRIVLPENPKHPVIACTPAELARLRAAYEASGPDRQVVAAAVRRADRAVGKPPAFPPRGGQHNQWYQCDDCQLGLKTLDDTHHQCPRCQKVYTGEPYDDVIFARQHEANLRNMTAAAWAYAITGQKKYAQYAAQVLLGYAQRYQEYPYHDSGRRTGARASRSGGRLFEQTLNEASCMTTQIAPAYDLIHDSGVLSRQNHDAIRAGLLRPMLANIEKHQAGKSNWQTWHNAGMLWGGAVIGDLSYVRKAVADKGNGFAFQMNASVTSDGMWYENSWGYHFYTLRALVALAEGARRLGIDLWGHPALKRMFTLPARYTMADGSLPRFGDDVRTSARTAADLMESAGNAYKDPAIAALLPSTPTWQSILLGRQVGPAPRRPALGSEVFNGAGHAILRSTGPAGLTAAMTFGPYGGFHGHFDKLSFVFFGYGRELGVDPGRAASQAYRLPIHGQWYKATLGHNAVLVDAASQKPAEGKLELFAATDTHAAVAASCDAAYPGVTHRRLLVLTPTYLLVFDDLTAAADRRFDWVYHNRGSSVHCELTDKPGKLGRSYVGQEYVKNVMTGTTAELVRVRFADKDVTTYLTADAQGGTEVRIGDGVGASVLDRVPLAMITRRGRTARFAAVLEPVKAGQSPAVTAVALDQTQPGIRIRIQNGDLTETLALTQDNTLTFSRGEEVILSSHR